MPKTPFTNTPGLTTSDSAASNLNPAISTSSTPVAIHEVPAVEGTDPRIVLAVFIGWSDDDGEVLRLGVALSRHKLESVAHSVIFTMGIRGLRPGNRRHG